MNKQDTIKSLKQCVDRQDFIMTRIRNSINQRRENEILDVLHQTTAFGSFLYDENNRLRPLLGSILFDGIGKYYEQWKETCDSIFNMLVVDKTARKPKLKKITGKDEDIIKAIFDDLMTIHDNLKRQCETGFARLNALSDDKFS
ncbi:hypothetical protein [Campylobacter corcagiensis]|uniref:Uncharacterized protein n=1 Tax=Campylobacter corcagiensis TaxID=1448857 RepID=A0A7M1LE69_9BACT|nr:hypothetical protein [Campylobacter corcagiensis]QKF64974.1 hypothetical protein CCORG_1125 [Campylobacter corcagiensis]QOQ86869.1 hypothetical protein IMC76_06540 [Campylobacter corcagiensis]